MEWPSTRAVAVAVGQALQRVSSLLQQGGRVRISSQREGTVQPVTIMTNRVMARSRSLEVDGNVSSSTQVVAVQTQQQVGFFGPSIPLMTARPQEGVAADHALGNGAGPAAAVSSPLVPAGQIPLASRFDNREAKALASPQFLSFERQGWTAVRSLLDRNEVHLPKWPHAMAC